MNARNRIAEAGNTGPSVRSDCFIILKIRNSGGITIDLNSKVKTMYGSSIEVLCKEVLAFFGISNANLTIDDCGALPFVIAARLEAAVKQCVESDKEFLQEILPENLNESTKDRFRITRLYLPGNTPRMMINAGIHKPDGIILDLEDSVAPVKKEEARYLVRNVLRSINFYGAERMVRINQFPEGLKDLKLVVPHNVHLILVPKCESAEQIQTLENEIESIKKTGIRRNRIFLMPIIESALGVEKAFEIATSSENVVAMAIGLEDYTADIGVKRTKEARESFFARTRLVNACKAAGIQPIDSVFSDVGDMEGLAGNVRISKSLGFEGMGCIHPGQIRVIRENYAPDPEEIDKAKQVVKAFLEAEEKGLGVISLGNKMIDPPVVKRAERTITLAIRLGQLSEDWNNE
ncbi:MAG: citrate lyase subunit beta [Bacteroidales bacterium]|nr:MAG: citrate lyase subunit beta [Bacteroidales bacterium]